MKVRAIIQVVVLFLLISNRCQSEEFSLGTQVPEIFLEARTMVYYRPSLLLETIDHTDPRADAFQRRLRYVLELAGTMEILDHRPDSTTIDQSDQELLTELAIVPASGFVQSTTRLNMVAELTQGPEKLPIQQWPLELEEFELDLQAADLAKQILYLLTGVLPAYDSQILYTAESTIGSSLVLSDFFGEARQVLAGPSSYKFSPAWHPDGTQLAIVVLSEMKGTGIWLGSLNGGPLKSLIETGDCESAPAFSPDGSHLACALSRDGNTDIWLLQLNPQTAMPLGRPRRLTHSPGIDTNPSWSPDGRNIVFASDRSGTLQIYRIGFNGLDEQRLTFLGGASDCPAWSPDGEWILFVSRERQGFQLFQMRPDGSDWVRLSDQSGNHFDPCWSPDSRLIAFNWRGDSWVARADGSERRKISIRSGESPAWRPLVQPTEHEKEQ